MGVPIEAVLADGKSDLNTFAREAERLIVEEKVDVVFGCWISASRKKVKPIFEKYNHLLFYSLQYEGLEESPNIVYTGANPNQQIIPATLWCMRNFGKKVFLVGSDYVFPRSAHEILKELISNLGGNVVGEEYIALGSEHVAPVIKKIEEAKPDFIINTINGMADNGMFFNELRLLWQKTGTFIPVLSSSITIQELYFIGIENFKGHYLAWSYFQAIKTDRNKNFVQKFKEYYGKQQMVNGPMEAAYFGVYIWKNIVEEIGTSRAHKVVEAVRKKYLSYRAPEGFVAIDQDSLLTWKKLRISHIDKDGKNTIIWTSLNPIKPESYPSETLLFKYFPKKKTKEQWNQYLQDMYANWGNQWQPK